jgi:DNA repair protein RadC
MTDVSGQAARNQIKDDPMETLYIRSGSEFREATREEIIARAQALISQRFRTGSRPMSNPDFTAAFLRLHLGNLDYEVFGVLFLDTRHRLIAIEDMFRGTINTASVYPREIAQAILKHRAASVILYHNHPSSGVAEPSAADEAITRKIQQALDLFDVKVLDHVIVGESTFSFAQAGLL